MIQSLLKLIWNLKAENSKIETVQDFLIKLDIKPLMHLLEIGIKFPITVPLGDWLKKKKVTAIIIKQQFGFPMSTT